MTRAKNRSFSSVSAMIVAFASLIPGVMLAPAASAADDEAHPPANFKKVSTLVKLPDFLPGLGTLFVDPLTLPIGPFLGYNHNGELVNVIYMVPLKDLEAHKNFEGLGQVAAGMKVNHTDIQFNPGHPGVEEPHYHIVQWFISPAEAQKDMQ